MNTARTSTSSDRTTSTGMTSNTRKATAEEHYPLVYSGGLVVYHIQGADDDLTDNRCKHTIHLHGLRTHSRESIMTDRHLELEPYHGRIVRENITI